MIDENIAALVLRLERAVWQALVDGDPEADKALLADDFVGVYATGFANRQDHVDQLSNGPSVIDYSLQSANVVEIADGHVRLSYEARYRRVAGGVERMYVTSLWSLREGRWVNTFSQDTLAAEDPIAPDER